jgi:hypothetical protein
LLCLFFFVQLVLLLLLLRLVDLHFLHVAVLPFIVVLYLYLIIFVKADISSNGGFNLQLGSLAVNF